MTLPITLKPKKNYKLSRSGRNNDGGYLVSEKTFNESKTLISFGILDDCSFENDFKKINPVSIFCYDNTVNKSFWIKKIYNDLNSVNDIHVLRELASNKKKWGELEHIL